MGVPGRSENQCRVYRGTSTSPVERPPLGGTNNFAEYVNWVLYAQEGVGVSK